MRTTAFLNDLFQSISEHGRSVLGQGNVIARLTDALSLNILRGRSRASANASPEDLLLALEDLLSLRGEVSGVALARDILDRLAAMSPQERQAFLTAFAERFAVDTSKLDAAIAAYQAKPDHATARAIHDDAEPRTQEVLRRLNAAPGATASLVRLREDLLRMKEKTSANKALDRDFRHLFGSWFNRGFLVMRRIDWGTPANILEKIIAYEAVHSINDWDDLRRRLVPGDRRCFGFFHPALADEPLIFVEVALTAAIPEAIGPVLASEREAIAPEAANTAVFYSISNCQDGLRGISFGNDLIKQVVDDLRAQLPNLTQFVTLSPVPGFRKWLEGELADRDSSLLDGRERAVLGALAEPAISKLEVDALTTAAAKYFLVAQSAQGKTIDPVARFHLGNGARLERINPGGDLSEKGWAQSYGLMVNYLYELKDLIMNHEAFAQQGLVAASPEIIRRAGAAVKTSKHKPK
ncbi:MAG TPA: malonyl-CoA decarboxylase [Stellaceae bacterium]|nr:malonyl-CoA decarboxylase [Stellaceae bacterium]